MAETDYRALCRDLFGTDDAQKLTEIAQKLQQNNPRGAGRKRKFTPAQVEEMKTLQRQGFTVNELADRYKTSRQIVSKYLTPPPAEGCTLRLTYMYRQTPCTVIDVDFLARKIYTDNKTDDILHRAFGAMQEPTWQDFENFLQERCFPPARGNRKALLSVLGLDSYDPLQIVEKTKGRLADDDMWLKVTYFSRKGDRHESALHGWAR